MTPTYRWTYRDRDMSVPDTSGSDPVMAAMDMAATDRGSRFAQEDGMNFVPPTAENQHT